MVILLFFFMPLWAPGIFSNMILQELSAPIGGSVLFQVKLSPETYLNSIFWTSIRKGKKQMLAIAKPDSFRVIDSTFKKRLKCQEPGQTLNVSDLREEDSGIYEAAIYGSGNTTHLLFRLQVNSKSKDKAGSYSGGAPGTWNNICLTTFGILISYIIGKT
ncbi:T-lymphocyte surface antigen Ly-9-like [Lithobates pipiens]